MSSTTSPGLARDEQLITEHALSIEHAPDAGKDVFRNAVPLWQPIWARGVFGGALIAQSLMAAQKTTPPGFFAHSMHCQFVRPARIGTPISYHVVRIRDGKTIAARSVHVQQSGEYIFAAQVSFARDAGGSPAGERKTLHHQAALPAAALASGPPTKPGEPIDQSLLTRTCQAAAAAGGGLYECVQIPRVGSNESRPELTKLLQWIRIRKMAPATAPSRRPDESADDRVRAHLAALAYFSDHYFIGTALRVNDGQRFAGSASTAAVLSTFDMKTAEGRQKQQLFSALIQEELDENAMVAATKPSSAKNPPVTAEFMVSLDHSIYFHEPTAVHADDWMLIEAESPWSGHERGLVIQRIWNTAGVLVATCVQEGVIRVKQDLQESKI